MVIIIIIPTTVVAETEDPREWAQSIQHVYESSFYSVLLAAKLTQIYPKYVIKKS